MIAATCAPAVTIPAGLEFCSRCGGDGHHGFEEESGLPFSCFACGESGYQPLGTAAAEEQAEQEAELDRQGAQEADRLASAWGWV